MEGPGLKSYLLAPQGSPKSTAQSLSCAVFSNALKGKAAPNPGLSSLDFCPSMNPGLIILHSPTHSLGANAEHGGGVGMLGANWHNCAIDILLINTHISSHPSHLHSLYQSSLYTQPL